MAAEGFVMPARARSRQEGTQSDDDEDDGDDEDEGSTLGAMLVVVAEGRDDVGLSPPSRSDEDSASLSEGKTRSPTDETLEPSPSAAPT